MPGIHRLARVALLLAAALASAANPARAVAQQTPTWSLTTADLRTDAVALRAVGPDGLTVAPAGGGGDRTIPLDQFVDLSRQTPPAARAGKFDLVLVGGDRLNGDPVGMKGEALVWRNPVVGEVPVPLRLLAALVRADGRPSLDRRREDEVTLGNGDVVRGAITELSPRDGVVVKTDAGDAPLPFASVTSVAFATTAAAAAGPTDKPSFRVRLDEGSSVAASAVRLAAGGRRLEATLGTGASAAAASIDLARVTLVEQVNGPVAFLSSRPPSANVYTPYLGSDQRFLARFNADFEGNPIRFRDRTYARSVATHAYSKVAWPLDGSYAAFRTRYAMDPKAAQGGGGDVTVRVLLDDKVAYEKANVRPGALSPPVVVDLGGAKSLTLEVDYGRQMDSNDRLNWLEPALLKVKPAAENGAGTTPN